MGGTSTDVSRYDGTYEHVFESVTAGITIQAPQVCILEKIRPFPCNSFVLNLIALLAGCEYSGCRWRIEIIFQIWNVRSGP